MRILPFPEQFLVACLEQDGAKGADTLERGPAAYHAHVSAAATGRVVIGNGVSVPLAQLLERLVRSPGSMRVLVELPPCDSLDDAPIRETLGPVLDAIRASAAVKQVILTSADFRYLRQAKLANPSLTLWPKTLPLPWYSADLPGLGLRPGLLNAWLSPFADEFERKGPAAVVSRLGGAGWLSHHSDIDATTHKQAQAYGLSLVSWASEQVRVAEWLRLISAGIDGFVAGPSSTRESAGDVKRLLETMKEANAAKKSHRALACYEVLVGVYGAHVPESGYFQGAVALRMLRRYSDCNIALQRGLEHFPDSSMLQAESAPLEMARGRWSEAVLLWRALDARTDFEFSARHFSRYAKCVEVVGTSEEYGALINRAVLAFPRGPDLLWRAIHHAARTDLENQRWCAAASKLTLFDEPRPAAWPAAYRVVAKKALAELDRLSADSPDLHRLELNCARRDRLRGWAEDVVGLSAFVDAVCSDLPAARALSEALRVLERAAHRFDGTVISQMTCEFEAGLAELARVVQREKLPSDWLPSEGWLTLANLMIAGRYLHLYHETRMKAACALARQSKEVLADLKGASKKQLRGQLSAAAEHCDEVLYERLHASHRRGELNLEGKDAAVLHVAALYFGRIDDFRAGMARDYPKFTSERAELLAGKSVAIVGPVDVGLDNGEEIDGFDVVIRFNYQGLEAYRPERFGTRTDVSMSIDKDLPKAFVSTKLVNKLSGLRLVLVDNRRSSELPTMGAVKAPVRLRYPTGDVFTNCLLKGTSNAIQRALIDFLRFPAKRIKVFNSNFFCEPATVTAYRVANYPQLDFTRHDPVSNFHFVKRLYELGCIEVDSVLHDVLSLDSLAYVARLQRTYGRNVDGQEAPR